MAQAQRRGGGRGKRFLALAGLEHHQEHEWVLRNEATGQLYVDLASDVDPSGGKVLCNGSKTWSDAGRAGRTMIATVWVETLEKKRLGPGTRHIDVGAPENSLRKRWDDKLQELEAFHAEHGHCQVAQKKGPHSRLAKWLCNQRGAYRKGELSGERLERLNALGFCGGVSLDDKWERRFGDLIRFKQKHGHCRVLESQNKELEVWIKRQRRKKRDGKLSKDLEDRLNAVGFHWARPDDIDDRWERRFDELVQFKQEHGHCMVLWSQNSSLENWIKRQRRNKRGGKLRKDHEDRLDAVGFRWCWSRPEDKRLADEDKWEKKFRQVVEYKKVNGDCKLCDWEKSNDLRMKELAYWVGRQRRLEWEGTLREDRKARLDEIGVQWWKGQRNRGQGGRWPRDAKSDSADGEKLKDPPEGIEAEASDSTVGEELKAPPEWTDDEPVRAGIIVVDDAGQSGVASTAPLPNSPQLLKRVKLNQHPDDDNSTYRQDFWNAFGENEQKKDRNNSEIGGGVKQTIADTPPEEGTGMPEKVVGQTAAAPSAADVRIGDVKAALLLFLQEIQRAQAMQFAKQHAQAMQCANLPQLRQLPPQLPTRYKPRYRKRKPGQRQSKHNQRPDDFVAIQIPTDWEESLFPIECTREFETCVGGRKVEDAVAAQLPHPSQLPTHYKRRLRPDDLPAIWIPTDREESSFSTGVTREVATCVGGRKEEDVVADEKSKIEGAGELSNGGKIDQTSADPPPEEKADKPNRASGESTGEAKGKSYSCECETAKPTAKVDEDNLAPVTANDGYIAQSSNSEERETTASLLAANVDSQLLQLLAMKRAQAYQFAVQYAQAMQCAMLHAQAIENAAMVHARAVENAKLETALRQNWQPNHPQMNMMQPMNSKQMHDPTSNQRMAVQNQSNAVTGSASDNAGSDKTTSIAVSGSGSGNAGSDKAASIEAFLEKRNKL